MSRRGRLAVACVAFALAPASPAAAQGPAPSTLPGGSLSTVREAAGQLFWVGPTDGAKVSLYTRPAAGGAVRLLGTVPAPGPKGDAYVASMAFDGTSYAVSLRREEEEPSGGTNEDDCGVCEADVEVRTEVIAGRLDGAPRALFTCTTHDQGTPSPAVALAAGRTFLANLSCDGPSGVVTIDSAGALTSFDPAGTAPLQGAGSWLTYASKDATKVTDLAGGGSYTVPVAYTPDAQDPQTQALLLQADGSILLSGAFFRAGGATPPVPVRTKWRYSVPETLFAGDRLFYAYAGVDLAQLAVTAGQGPRAIVVPALAAKRPLLLTGSMLDVAGYTCTGVVSVRSLDLGAAVPAGAVDGCPVEVTTGALRLTAKRTIAVAVRCVNGCTGTLTLQTGDLELSAKVRAPAGGKATVRYRLTRKQLKAVGRSATFASTSQWLTMSGREHRLSRPRSSR